MGVKAGCKPRKEVLHGDLDDAIFAADFGNPARMSSFVVISVSLCLGIPSAAHDA